MTLPANFLKAVYRDPGLQKYQGNPFIEALPPIIGLKELKKGLEGVIEFNPKDLFEDGNIRAHLICQVLYDFFQPFASHYQLESKLSIMIRQGYVGRNPSDGTLNLHMQNGYERVQSGDLDVFRYKHAKSTALSLSLIGCSGCGKSTTLTRILATYPQVIYHDKLNLTQIVYLKVDCPNDGSLKSLCMYFFRAIDQLLKTDYERKYGMKRHSVPILLAIMSQLANAHAIGVLVIDEIQHLSQQFSGGVESMLNFFVTLVNVIGIPVVLVGTPKARRIFEIDLRSARRSAGFGALLWEPMKNEASKIDKNSGKLIPSEWVAFTDKLWKYQWLQKRDENLSDEIRESWYDLSQGVVDIVVKLFVLAQLRAIVTRTERITVKLLKQVYDDELKPVHPMLAALRSGDVERIMEYSDLYIPDMDHKVLNLRRDIEKISQDVAKQDDYYGGNEQARKLHIMLVGLECNPDLIRPLVEQVISEYPEKTILEMMSIVLERNSVSDKPVKSSRPRLISVKQKDWSTLDTEDIRFQHSQSDQETSVYQLLKKTNVVFDVDTWMKLTG